MYLAAGRAEAAVASILAGGQPLVLALAGWTLFGERPSGRPDRGPAAARRVSQACLISRSAITRRLW